MLSCLRKSPLKPKHNFLEKKEWDGQIPEEQEGEKILATKGIDFGKALLQK